MFKKIIIALAFAIALPIVASAQKFGTVNVEPIIVDMPEYKEMQNQMNEASKKYEDEFSKLRDDMQKKYTEFQTLDADPNTPQQIKERRLAEIQESQNKIEQFRQVASQDLQTKQQQLMAPIEQKVMEAIKAIGQEGGYTFILPEGVAAYSGKDVTDVSAQVRTKLGLK